jgi:hypothetical protein
MYVNETCWLDMTEKWSYLQYVHSCIVNVTIIIISSSQYCFDVCYNKLILNKETIFRVNTFCCVTFCKW